MKRKKIAPIFENVKKAKKDDEHQDESDTVTAEPREWKILSWNVAGARAWVKKNGHKLVGEHDADLVFLGETKCQEVPPELKTTLKDYHTTMAVSTVKSGGYAGVALFSKEKPLKTWKGIGDARFDDEGRLIIAEYPRFFFAGAYVPNSGRGLVNLAKRGIWEELMREKLKKLKEKKPVIYVGDLNVAHQEIDLANPKSNANKTAGFTDQEREDFGKMLEECELVDTFREMNPDKKGAYTYWSYFANARGKNVGWRLDYSLVSTSIYSQVSVSDMIEDEAATSDHGPIVLKIADL